MSQRVSTNSLPAKNFGVGVHDIQGLFEAPILNKADDFTVKGRHVIFVFMQNYDTRDAQQQLKQQQASKETFQRKSRKGMREVLRFGAR